MVDLKCQTCVVRVWECATPPQSVARVLMKISDNARF